MDDNSPRSIALAKQANATRFVDFATIPQMVFPNIDASCVVGEALLFLNSSVSHAENLGGPISNHLHPIGLWFTNDDLEQSFVNGPAFSSFISVRLVRSLNAAFLLGLVGWTAFAWRRDISPFDFVLQNMLISLICLHSVICLFSMTPWYASAKSRQYTIFTGLMVTAAGISKTLTATGVYSLIIFGIIVFVVFRGRFFPAFCICIFDLVFYNMFLILTPRTDGQDIGRIGRDLTVIDYLALFLIFVTAFSSYQYERSIREAFLLQRQNQLEQARTHRILDNIFPPHVAALVKARAGKNDIISHAEPAVSILFCDILDFFNLVATLTPSQLVQALNTIYSAFDVLSEFFHVQKMETVGKTYMACAGLPDTRDDHELACVEMALTMIDLMQMSTLSVRIGINTGPVISGVVGLTRPQYCLFGDVVNTASRCQSTGLKGCVSISERTYASIADQPFHFEPRCVHMKGKGEVTTYLVYPADELVVASEVPDASFADDSFARQSTSRVIAAPSRRLVSGSSLANVSVMTIPPIPSEAGPRRSSPHRNIFSEDLDHSLPSSTVSSLEPKSSSRFAVHQSSKSVEIAATSTRISAHSTSSPLAFLDGYASVPSVELSPKYAPLSVSAGVSSFVQTEISHVRRAGSVSHLTTRAPVRALDILQNRAPNLGYLSDSTSSSRLSLAIPISSVPACSDASLNSGGSRSRSVSADLSRVPADIAIPTPPEIVRPVSIVAVETTTHDKNQSSSSSTSSASEKSFASHPSNTSQSSPALSRIPSISARISSPVPPLVDTLLVNSDGDPEVVDQRANSLQAQEFATIVDPVGEHVQQLLQNESRRPLIAPEQFLHYVDAATGEPLVELEDNFRNEQVLKARALRFPIIIGILFCALEAGLDVANWTNTSYMKHNGFLTIVSVRCLIVFLGLTLLALPYLPRSPNPAQLFRIQYAGSVLCLLLNLFLPMIVKGALTDRSVQIHIFFLTIINNVGMRFQVLVPSFVSLFLIWVTIAFSSIGQNTVGSIFTWILWITVASVANAVITYGRELFLRKGFLLTRQLQSERKKADEFLYHMLPRDVAQELRQGHNGVAEEFRDLSILYSDIKGFTEYSASSTPERVVQLLSTLFTAFDQLNSVHNVYKIQTIGDAYVCCSGVPFLKPGTPKDHAINCVWMGLSMLSEIDSVRTVEGGRVQMRIGIHTGKVVAGVVGTKKLRYDMWGVDCLVANMCESNSEPGCILLSEDTEKFIRGEFPLEQKQAYEVQGKPFPIMTFLLRPSRL